VKAVGPIAATVSEEDQDHGYMWHLQRGLPAGAFGMA
jgi:hypothetical protein